MRRRHGEREERECVWGGFVSFVFAKLFLQYLRRATVIGQQRVQGVLYNTHVTEAFWTAWHVREVCDVNFKRLVCCCEARVLMFGKFRPKLGALYFCRL